jgi:hypothetical protein
MPTTARACSLLLLLYETSAVLQLPVYDETHLQCLDASRVKLVVLLLLHKILPLLALMRLTISDNVDTSNPK